MERISENDIAIIGMAARFPEAKNIKEYWQNLVNGVNSIKKASEEAITASALSDDIVYDKRFVNASSRLEDARYFDADFFGLSNTEAMLMDPQIRLLLQTSWHALEDAGYDISRLDATVGNFCGMSTNSYLMRILDTHSLTETVDPLLYRILNEKDFLATWISYKLNLTGPAMSVQTACSTSLLAVHLACQSLLNAECDIALAGGTSYNSHEHIGYVHVPESILSKDGDCRPFDKDASGTVIGDGVGAVVLKRAADAVKDSDHIYALIKGTATNNDGANKQGYTTPSINCQRDVILEALSVADINPETIGMIEAHGTGTLIGDPIEVAALTEAFSEFTGNTQYCALGSVKGNIGHLDAAAGVASLIKAVLCVNKGVLMPNINFADPNPTLQLEASPFYVSRSHCPWPGHFGIRRAGVSSLGVGGTNVHVIVEQPPQQQQQEPVKRPYIITLSALNQKNLQRQKEQLSVHLLEHSEIRLEDIEFTTLYGRKVLPYRFSTICYNKEELIAQLEEGQNERSYEGYGDHAESVFLFPGQGSQFPGMAASLYETDEAFKKDMDYCFRYMETLSGIDFKGIIFSDDGTLLEKTENTQVVLFIIEYCLAKALLRLGITPDAIVGHSLGEYVAACISECLSLEAALKLVYHRGRLMGAMQEGAMLLVRLPESELTPLLADQVSVCVVNSRDNIVVGGPVGAIQQQSMVFDINNVKYKKLEVSHAYHTSMMSGVLEDYAKVLAEVEFIPPNTKIFSTHTGNQVSPEVFCSHQYWLDQILHPVKFLHAVEEVSNYISNPVFIEVGPGNGLSSFIKAIFNQQASTINLMPRTVDKGASLIDFYKGKALLYVKGLAFRVPETHKERRVPLPGYPFSRHYFWKPGLNIQYNDFDEIKQAYHHTNDRYLSDRLKISVEIQIAGGKEVPDTMLDSMSQIHAQYINGIRKLISGWDEKLHTAIEVLYDDIPFQSEDELLLETKSFNKKRAISSVFVAPKSGTENIIAGHWESVLGYHPAGILDNYFEAGGNSLLATKLMTQLSDEFDIELTFRELSETLNIKELATLVVSKKKMVELVDSLDEGDNNDGNYIEL